MSFETPDKNYTPGQTTLNLFLYEVKENHTLRDPEPLYVLEHGDYRRRMPPMRVDCAYLVTAWSNETAGVKAAEEHRLLGQAMAWLGRFDTIPETFFQGALVGQPYPPPTLVAQTDGKQNISEFWSALGISPRLAFTLVVTIALDLDLEYPMGPEVISHEVQLGAKDGGPPPISAYTIGGTVRTADRNALVVGAAVSIVERGLATQTDPLGRFRFVRLSEGTYTLRCTASGFMPVEQTIEVPSAAAGGYHLTLRAT
ncbi:MAG: Pvc16 family protein [Caldilineaceae bacterium]